MRKLPVVERRGHSLHVVIDAHTNARAWISEVQESESGTDVDTPRRSSSYFPKGVAASGLMSLVREWHD